MRRSGDRGDDRDADDRRDIRLRGLDFTAHQQPLPGQSIHAPAGTQRPVSFAGKDRRRDFPDVPGFGGDSAGDQRADHSAADYNSGRDWRTDLSRDVRLPDGADRFAADSGEFYFSMDFL